MATLQRHLLATSWLRTTLYALGMCGYALVILAAYPTVREQAATFDDLLKNYPEALMKAFGLDQGVRFGQLPDYLATELYSFAWLIVALIMALTIGSSIVAAEVESGNLALWLATGLSRGRYLAAHWLAFLVQLGALIAGTDLAIVAGTMAQGTEVPWSGLGAVSVHGAVFVLVAYAVAGACSTVYSDRGPAARLAICLIFFSYALSVVSGLVPGVDWLHSWTIFYLFDPLSLLRSGALDWSRIAAGTALTLVLFALSWWHFHQRDLALG